MINVGIIGYGTIGKRVADAVLLQDDMKLVGVTARSLNQKIYTAAHKKIPLYAVDDGAALAEHGIPTAGSMDDLLAACDIVVDCTPGGMGAENVARYKAAGVKAILQGGEEADAAQASFCAPANYDEAIGKEVVRVVSCNTTALSRVLGHLARHVRMGRISVTLMRRAMDPGEKGKTVMNAVEPSFKFPSHHGPDVQSVLPELNVFSVAFKVPTTLMHVHALEITLEEELTTEQAREILRSARRVRMLPGNAGIDTTANIMELGKDLGHHRGDMMEASVWEKSVVVEGRRLHLFIAVHQESIVVPENIDCIRAMMGQRDGEASMRATDESLGIPHQAALRASAK